ncbi:MAG: hypothetical protein AMJ62_07205 [Myxococcales bacterium SG8_38]|nr:MAG: hypothetical protein AMJ62_07205 [Myxococcales bacterium SG8_38]
MVDDPTYTREEDRLPVLEAQRSEDGSLGSLKFLILKPKSESGRRKIKNAASSYIWFAIDDEATF